MTCVRRILFSWLSAGLRNVTSTGPRYFSINGGVTNIVNFSQDPHGDFGDWLSAPCPQGHPYVQNAFTCRGQSSDVTTTSPEGVNLDVIGYDLLNLSGFLIPDTTCRGMVFDFAGQDLYVSTTTGLIKAFNLSTASLVRTYNLGGSLNGIDIARDDSFILAAQNHFSTAQGTFQRVNLANGSITDIHYTPERLEGGGWDVAIASNGLALVTTWFQGSGYTPLRQIDLSTNAITIRGDAPGSGFGGEVSNGTQIHRSKDGTRLFFMEGDISSGPVFTYNSVTDTFGERLLTNVFLDSASGAVNRSGNLLGFRTDRVSASLRRASDFGFVHGFSGIDGSFAFDAVRDIFYGVNSSTDEIVAYSTSTFVELFRLPVGEDVGPEELQFGPGKIVTSADGRWLALETSSGVRVFRLPNATTSTRQARLDNISTRASVQTGQSVMIGGFIVQGSAPKKVIIRAIGPELTQYGITDALADPRLELHSSTGALIASNDNWQTTEMGGVITENQVSDIQNSGHAPTAAREPAIIANLQPGNYTAIVRGNNNATGVGLVEVYDLNADSTSNLGNISTRSLVQTGQNVMIGGFIVGGTGPKRVIVRAIGPELTQHGITNALADPVLELHNRAGALIARNDNWQTTITGGLITSDQIGDIQRSGHAPTATSESAIIANLQPGNYTAIVRGSNNLTGVALVEVYDLN